MAIEAPELDGLKIRKGQQIMMSIYSLDNDDTEWYEPSRFIPERFDPTH